MKPASEGAPAGSAASATPKPGATAAGESSRAASAASSAALAAAAAARRVTPAVRDDASELRLAQRVLDRLSRRERTTTWLIATIAFAAVISAAISGLLWRELNIAADRTAQAIQLNRDGLQLARENTQRQLRAYTSVIEFKCGGCGDNAGPDEVFLRAANEGQTPALNVYARIGWSAGDARCGTNGSGFSYNYVQARYFKGVRTFSKDARDVTTFDLNREAVQQARSGNARLCVYGTVNYTTIFNDSEERETRFCYWYNRGSERAPCEDHNGQN